MATAAAAEAAAAALAPLLLLLLAASGCDARLMSQSGVTRAPVTGSSIINASSNGVSGRVLQGTGKSPSKAAKVVPKTWTVGATPSFWAVGVQSSWKAPRVRQNDTLEFRWDANSKDGPHDVWAVDAQTYKYCVFPSKFTVGRLPYRLGTSGNTGLQRFKVKAKAKTVLYFACAFTYHCDAGMKVQITVSS